jgi:uncharacterized protein (DUF2225 family)
MGLLSGLEKFGLSLTEDLDITDDGKGKQKKAVPKASGAAVKKLEEKDLVLQKIIMCPVCDKKFPTLTAKTTKAKRLEPDKDLRPNHEGIDTLKYEVTACPFCGYSAMNKFFDHLSTAQIKWVKEAVSKNFAPQPPKEQETYSYDESVDKYKLALVCAMAKHAKLSEKSLICLRISWLRRSQIAELSDHNPEDLAKKKELREEMEGFYKQAYDGFNKAISTETPPYCGMDTNTVEYLLANMAVHFKDYQTASKLVSALMQSSNTPARVKDKCYDLKEQIVAEVKAAKAKAAKAQAAKAQAAKATPPAAPKS